MTNAIPIKAKVLIGMVAVASLCPLSFGVINWRLPAWPQLALLIAAAILSSRFKVKLPGMTSTMSGNRPGMLLGCTQLGLFACLLLSVTAAFAQSYASGLKSKPVQVFFNVCTLMNATALAYVAFHSRLFMAAWGGTALSLVLAAATYFLANTAPVAGIIGLTEGHSPVALWHKVFLWSFPNYVIGAGLTAIASLLTTVTALATIAALLAVLFGVYRCYRMYVSYHEQPQPKALAMAAR